MIILYNLTDYIYRIPFCTRPCTKTQNTEFWCRAMYVFSVPFSTQHYNPKFFGFNAGLKVEKHFFLNNKY